MGVAEAMTSGGDDAGKWGGMMNDRADLDKMTISRVFCMDDL